MKFLGHIVTPEGIVTDPDKRKAIQNFPQPKRLKGLRSFLGLTNYYARFVHRYRDIARPLYRLTRKHIPFIWTQDCQEAFDKLKHVLQSPPVLAYPDFSKQFILETDCSNFSMGFVLSKSMMARHMLYSTVEEICRTRNRSIPPLNGRLWLFSRVCITINHTYRGICLSLELIIYL